MIIGVTGRREICLDPAKRLLQRAGRETRAHSQRRSEAMTMSGRYGQDAGIEELLSTARRELLGVAVATCAIGDDAAAIASARLRWAIASARQLIMALGDEERAE